MVETIKKIMLFNIDKKEFLLVRDDILEDNRRCCIIYAYIVTVGMLFLFAASYLVDVLASSRTMYELAIGVGIVLLFLSMGPAKKYLWVSAVCEYLLIGALLIFGILLGTVAEPNQASVSFAVLMFVTPMLFTDLAFRLNVMTILGIIVYIVAAGMTQTSDMFAFNMSVVLPYGLTSLFMTHFICRLKIERSIYAHDKKIMGEYDRLTGLLNRWSFELDLEKLKTAESETNIVICSFDVNRLKDVNDTLGHKAGDEMLIAAAEAINKNVSQYGRCYRIGGDEFMAILEGEHPMAEELLEKVNRDAALYHSKYGFEVSVSGGIVEGSNRRIDDLILEADKQMYQRKYDYYVFSGFDRRKKRD